MMTEKKFLEEIIVSGISNKERAIALLWFLTVTGETEELSVLDLCKRIEKAGFGKQNTTTLRKAFEKDRQVLRGSGKSFKISPTSFPKLSEKYSSILEIKKTSPSDSIIEKSLFSNARPYIRKVVDQLNGSYEYGWCDCCAVMCRRLLETLIIEAYEKAGLSHFLKGSDGYFFMFSGLLKHIKAKDELSLGRKTIEALSKLKTLGDLSAHHRRYNARPKDIYPIRSELRIASEELLILAGQGPS